jgi:hypothetical protein
MKIMTAPNHPPSKVLQFLSSGLRQTDNLQAPFASAPMLAG